MKDLLIFVFFWTLLILIRGRSRRLRGVATGSRGVPDHIRRVSGHIRHHNDLREHAHTPGTCGRPPRRLPLGTCGGPQRLLPLGRLRIRIGSIPQNVYMIFILIKIIGPLLRERSSRTGRSVNDELPPERRNNKLNSGIVCRAAPFEEVSHFIHPGFWSGGLRRIYWAGIQTSCPNQEFMNINF